MDIVRGISFPKEAKSLEPRVGHVACLRTANVQRDVEWGDLWFVPEQHVKREDQYVCPGDILISTANSYDLVGKVAPVRTMPHRATLGAFISLLRPREELDAKFAYYQISWSDTQDRIRSTASTTTNISNVSTKKLSNIELAFPPREQQQRIVAEIEKQFSRLDEAVANLKRVKANLKRYKAAVLKAAVEGKLTEEWRKAHPDVEPASKLLDRILAERRAKWEEAELAKMEAKGEVPKNDKWKAKYKEPAEPETTNLPALPEGWVWATWDQISNWVTYGFTRPMPHVEAGMPIVTAKHVVAGKIELHDTHKTPYENYAQLSDKDRPEAGDILITKDGTIGRAAVVPEHDGFCINQSVAVVWLRSCPILREYLLAVIESEFVQKPVREKARGVAIKHLSITDFAKLALPIPSMHEQSLLADEVDRRRSLIREAEAQVDANLQRAIRLRQAILAKAFSGMLAPLASIPIRSDAIGGQ